VEGQLVIKGLPTKPMLKVHIGIGMVYCFPIMGVKKLDAGKSTINPLTQNCDHTEANTGDEWTVIEGVDRILARTWQEERNLLYGRSFMSELRFGC